MGQLGDSRGRHPRDVRNRIEGVWLDRRLELLEAHRAVLDEVVVGQPRLDDLASDPIGQRNVSAHADAQPDIGELCR